MKIWCISDTHDEHIKLRIQNADMVIFAGDAADSHLKLPNYKALLNFMLWFKSLPIKHKVMIAGNHDHAIYHKMFLKTDFKTMGVHYLEHSTIEIEGLKIFGSPYTPSYNPSKWVFNMKRNRLQACWDMIPEKTDILITHGPPKGILDLTFEKESKHIKQVGCKSLYNRVLKIKPKLHVFGHVHDHPQGVLNCGLFERDGIKYVNASCVSDGQTDIKNHGLIVNI